MTTAGPLAALAIAAAVILASLGLAARLERWLRNRRRFRRGG